ncbi:MAG: SDR family oxidoreductase [Acidobacteria bacterium]|nr:SDR family oxidoreductase [Acidobacteriota bacterium]MCH7986048.1 SDR family oxidoreductase [Acidobacteriota bacterium]
MIDLSGQVAVVTGGSRGIGAATVELFAQAGAHVVFNYRRNRTAAQKVAERARRHGVEIIPMRADLSRMRDARALIDRAARRFRRLDILVANAGIWNQEDLPIEKLSEVQWEQMMAANLKSVYSVIHYAVPLMKRQFARTRRPARIIAISSTAGQRGEAFHSHYAASKGAIISLVKGLSTELARHHILVNCVAPGWVDTDMSQAVLRHPRLRRRVASQIPLGRPATAEEIAGPILFLASELATFLTGEIVNVNGGAVLVG